MSFLSGAMVLLPEGIIFIGAFLCLLSSFIKKPHTTDLAFSLAMIVACGAFFFFSEVPLHEGLGGMIMHSPFIALLKKIILASCIIILLLCKGSMHQNKHWATPELYVLLLIATGGMMLMMASNDLLSLYMSLELQSLNLYILASFKRDDVSSSEAGLKYFVLGALSSGILLLGCSLIYGYSGTTQFSVLMDLYHSSSSTPPIGMVAGLVFLLAGLCFKLSAAPFHMWTPDVYQGSPTPVTAFFATATKVSALGLLIKLLYHSFAFFTHAWQDIILFVSALSMIIGALGALQQTNIKRFIAFSSIGHVGYMLMGVATGEKSDVAFLVFYLVIYVTMNAGFFACLMLFSYKEDNDDTTKEVKIIGHFAGLAKTHPMLSAIIAILMLSQAGIPPLAGFFSKFYVFLAAIDASLYGLVLVGILTSVVGSFYYLRIIKLMYFDEPIVSLTMHRSPILLIIVAMMALCNAALWIQPSLLLSWITPIASCF